LPNQFIIKSFTSGYDENVCPAERRDEQ
jgi:hypothetical protein